MKDQHEKFSTKQQRYSLFTDVAVHGKTAGCFENNCKSTDKFDSASEEDCATVFVIAAVDDSALIYGDLSAGRTQEG